jgi:hypothetical protein
MQLELGWVTLPSRCLSSTSARWCRTQQVSVWSKTMSILAEIGGRGAQIIHQIQPAASGSHAAEQEWLGFEECP